MQTFESLRTIEADHPALAGHFPGNPVVPGVVILDCVLQALQEWLADVVTTQVQDAKFISPLLPDVPMQIQLGLRDEQHAGFECRVTDRLVAQGRLTLRRKGA